MPCYQGGTELFNASLDYHTPSYLSFSQNTKKKREKPTAWISPVPTISFSPRPESDIYSFQKENISQLILKPFHHAETSHIFPDFFWIFPVCSCYRYMLFRTVQVCIDLYHLHISEFLLPVLSAIQLVYLYNSCFLLSTVNTD